MNRLKLTLVCGAQILFLLCLVSGPGCNTSKDAEPASTDGGTTVTQKQETPPSGSAPKATPQASPAPTPSAPAENELVVLTTEVGRVVIDLFEDDAPKHAANFKKLVRDGFYSDKSFHRVFEGLMAQAGDPDPDSNTSTGNYGPNVPAEIKQPHKRGSVAMARKGDETNPTKESSGSQFFICLADLPDFDGQYTVFGKVTQGIDAVGSFTVGSVDANGMVPPAKRTKILKAELVGASKLAALLSQPITRPQPAEDEDMYVLLETTSGDIYIDLFEKSAPKHAANFKKLVNDGFYDGLTFHRVIEGFMAQGGDPEGTGSGGPGYQIDAEIGLPHLRGSVAAARQGDQVNRLRKSSGSQFFICFQKTSHLDAGGYSVFGHVVRGMDVVDKIPRGAGRGGSVPNDRRAVINKASLVPASKVEVQSPSPAQ